MKRLVFPYGSPTSALPCDRLAAFVAAFAQAGFTFPFPTFCRNPSTPSMAGVAKQSKMSPEVPDFTAVSH